MSKPRVAVTMGDPAGIGPEICLRILGDRELRERIMCCVFGNFQIMSTVAEQLGLQTPEKVVSLADWKADSNLETPEFIDINFDGQRDVTAGAINKKTGQASHDFVVAAIEQSKIGNFDAVTTAPIHKEAWNQAGITYPGHTEMFADKSNCQNFCMMLTSPEISCSLVTTHIGYRDVPKFLTSDRILQVIELSQNAASACYERIGSIAVCGLNPHAGEGGMFGNREEETIIMPAIEEARRQGINVEGPLSPDTAFVPARRNRTSCYVCMYHDQGLIPLKTLAFDRGVNVTLGLPFVRTSVDHGTACDIAWQGKADATSLRNAIELAGRLAASNSR